MTVRPARRDDLAAIERIAKSAYLKYVERIGREPAPMVADFERQIARGTVFLAVDTGGVSCGFVVFYPRGDGVHLENVAVLPGCQGRGIGRLLIAYVEDWAFEHGFRTIDLYTNEKMTENMALYPALGFVEIRRGEEDGFRRIFYRKKIGGTLSPRRLARHDRNGRNL